MTIFFKKYLVLFLLPFSFFCYSQKSSDEYKNVDEYVKSLGAMDSLNMGSISYALTKNFDNNKEKLRAIFYWETHNIQLDCKSARNGNNDKAYDVERILKIRKGTSADFASLFQDLCSVSKIRCLTVDGYIKRTVEDINTKPDEMNHTWDVIQLGQSPEQWYYVDPTMGSGTVNDKMTVFTPEFNDAFFFANKKIFNFQHYPNNTAWLIGEGTKSAREFISLPLVKDAAYEIGLQQFLPQSGYIKAKLNKPVEFSIMINSANTIDIVSVVYGDERKKKTKTVDYTFSGRTIHFTYKFTDEDEYPFSILINNKEVLKYMVEVKE